MKLKYVQQPIGKRAGSGAVIRPSKRIIYDTREAVVTFLSEDVDKCVDEFLEEWARVSKMVVIARESEHYDEGHSCGVLTLRSQSLRCLRRRDGRTYVPVEQRDVVRSVRVDPCRARQSEPALRDIVHTSEQRRRRRAGRSLPSVFQTILPIRNRQQLSRSARQNTERTRTSTLMLTSARTTSRPCSPPRTSSPHKARRSSPPPRYTRTAGRRP